MDEIYFLSKSLQQKKTEYELEGENREQFLTSEELDQILSSSHQLNQIVDIKKQKKKRKNKKRREVMTTKWTKKTTPAVVFSTIN